MAEEARHAGACDHCASRPGQFHLPGCPNSKVPAPDQGERDGLVERLEREIIGYSISLGLTEAQFDLLREAASRLRTSTEGGARPGDTPLNNTRTNSDRPWREDVARAFVTNRPAQPEGAGEARVKARKPDQDDLRMLRDMAEPNWATGLNPGQKAVIGRVLDALGVYGPAPSTPTEEEGA